MEQKQEQEYAQFGRHVGYVILANIITVLLVFIQLPILTQALIFFLCFNSTSLQKVVQKSYSYGNIDLWKMKQ